MAIAKETAPITEAADVIFPPSDLYSDEPPLETGLHLQQMMLLLNSLYWLWRDRNDFYAAGNLSIYFSRERIKTKDYRGPDFFVVLGTEKRQRKSWVAWEEDGKYPNLIVEILSDTTAKTDRETKKQIYQDIFRTPEYFWFDPESEEFVGFHLLDGCYESLEPNEHGWMWSQQLELFLGVHEGQLRFFAPDGALVPAPDEAAIEAMQRADQAEAQAARERQLKEQEKQRAVQAEAQAAQERQLKEQAQREAARLADRLRALGIDPDAL